MEVEFSVGLHDPFSYSLVWFLAALLVMIFAAVLFTLFYWRYRKLRADREEKPQIVRAPKIVLPLIRQKYTRQLSRLGQGYAAGQVEGRIAYQELSRVIRMFTYEATRIEAQNYTFSEIKALNMPQLTALLSEYYEPEFAKASRGDVQAALARAGQVIGTWR